MSQCFSSKNHHKTCATSPPLGLLRLRCPKIDIVHIDQACLLENVCNNLVIVGNSNSPLSLIFILIHTNAQIGISDCDVSNCCENPFGFKSI